MLDTLTMETFTPRMGETFSLTQDDGTIREWTLSEVEALGEAGSGEARRPFSLVFHGPPDEVTPQGMHRLHNPHLADLDLFLVPLGADDVGMRYQAVFT